MTFLRRVAPFLFALLVPAAASARPDGIACPPAPFLLATGIETDSPTAAIATADFNGDDHADVAVGGPTVTQIDILLGDGLGGFVPAAPLLGVAPYRLAIADVDGDGKADLVAGAGGRIAFFQGHGDGTFEPSLDSLTGIGEPRAMVVADFGSDGEVDIVLLDVPFNGGDIEFFEGAGDGTFGPPSAISVEGIDPQHLTAADFDEDDLLDLAVVTVLGSEILGGNGDGTFDPLVTLGGLGNHLLAADVTGDGHFDLIAAGTHDLAVAAGTGTGAFFAAVQTPLPRPAHSPALGDFDGDGLVDLVLIESGAAYILRGTGTAQFEIPVGFVVPAGGTPVVADFVEDGRPDVLVGDGGNRLGLLRNLGDMRFLGVELRAVGVGFFQSSFLTEEDFNEDGLPDLAFHNGLVVAVAIGNEDGTFTTTELPLPAGGVGTAFGDIHSFDANGDGHTDLAASKTTVEVLRVYLGRGDGTFEAGLDHPTFTTGVYRLDSGDLDGDGNADLVWTTGFPGVPALALGNGDGTFQVSISLAFAPFNGPLAVGDLDEDSDLDLIFTSIELSTVAILLGNGSGTFSFGPFLKLSDPPDALTLGDLDDDGDLDIVVGRAAANVFENDGSAGFQAPISLALAGPATAAAVFDIDEDGHADILVGSFEPSAGVQLLRGAGDLQFEALQVVSLAGGTSDLAIADFGGDGRFDVVALTGTAGEVAIVRSSLLGARAVLPQVRCVGVPLVLSSRASGYGPLTYQWRRDGNPLSDGGSVSGTATDTLTIDPASAADAGS